MNARYIKLDELILPTQINILLVEDERDISEIIEFYLTEIGFNGNYFHAANINEAKKFLAQHKIDFIIADKNLPDGSGDALVKAIRKSDKYFRNIPLLMVTGSASVDDHILSSKLGVSAYLTKPFTPDELKNKVTESFKSEIAPTEDMVHFLKKKVMQLEEEILDLKAKKEDLHVPVIAELKYSLK